MRAGQGRAVRPCDRQRERAAGDRGDDREGSAQRPAPSACEDPAEDQQGREHEVELLLHGQRPGVEQGVRGRVVREVVACRVPDDVVGGQEHGADAGARRGLLGAVGVLQEHGRRRHHGDEERERRGESQEPAEVEVREAHAPVLRPLAGQHPRDDEPGDHEEDVDADEATGHRQVRVEDDDEQDRDGAQALDVRASAGPRSVDGGGRQGAQVGGSRHRRSPVTTRTTPPMTTVRPIRTSRVSGSDRIRKPRRTATAGFT